MAMSYAYRGESETGPAAPIASKAGKTANRRSNPTRSRAATAPELEVESVVEPKTFEPDTGLEAPKPVATRTRRAQVEAEALERRNKRTERLAELEAKRDNLIDRLDVGAARIQEARTEGKDVTSWEDFWIQLLRSYEQVCDELRDLASQD